MSEYTYQVRADSPDKWTVSKFGNGSWPEQIYVVNYSRNRYWCNCPHGIYRKSYCKHVAMVKDHKSTGRIVYE